MNSLSGDKKANRLLNESSPYLQQHAYNPVDWFPWGDEALKIAEEENKLLIISIGYAACHWCHVMEHESFEDSLVAKIMNDNFISIKVDREERPDVDDVYMTAAQLINGSGGWPLNAIALPNGKPVFAGTYYPKDQWLNILNQISKLNRENPARLQESADKITEGIQSTTVIEVNENELDFDFDDFSTHIKTSLETFDAKFGGRLGAPKFPMPNAYELLLKQYWLSGDKALLEASKIGLDNMTNGGIYDQIGGGFARYSVDEYWLVPHFEKMLYDNGQLVSLYAQAYQMTGDEIYKTTVEQTLDFIKREMTSPEYGFYSSLDADSEGEEGKFYVWTKSEIDQVINDPAKAEIFNTYYDVTENGNWEGYTILNVVSSYESLSQKFDKSVDEIKTIITESSSKLLKARSKRVRPGTDDKILTSWNALMMTGYIDAYNALGTDEYLEAALNNANFILNKQINKEGKLNRNFKDGKSSINAFLDDYALTIGAFLKLYQSTFDKQWIDHAQRLTDYSLEHFYNEETKMFNYTSDLDPPLIAKKSEFEDNVIPSSNSAMARSLLTLGTLTYNTEYIEQSEQMLKNMMDKIKSTNYISFYSNWLQLLLDHTVAPFEVAIIGEDALTKRNELSKNYLGNSILLGSQIEENLALLKDKMQEGRTMIYVCQNKTCKLPLEDVEGALGLIKHQVQQ
ncbi:MAG: thioredoxin domain-containing protein [Saprospiraceae bacterium]|nr:thioredoxin domain-containing protein [Bacteroidia bacterium]NNE13975.1 thioredoxin domain-containing protein [Saprospiraceae bacterium]NNL92765.1 thioredoxin domain-containing protein [Saprospiraceae bacterium]